MTREESAGQRINAELTAAPYCEHVEPERRPFLKARCWSCIIEKIDAAAGKGKDV